MLSLDICGNIHGDILHDDRDKGMKIWFPHQPLYVSGDTAGNLTRQAESDRINQTQNRIMDTQKVINEFKKLIEDNGHNN
jgi:hypothetical protein